MSAVRWTEAQRRAIETRGCHVLVSAAAGSGKTAVLVERIVRRITEEGGDIDRLLVVTFTEAAAAQMRDRILQAIEARLAKNPGDVHLSRQLLLLPRASIATLHAFCLNVVRQHFYTLGLDPNVRVMDEQESYLMRLEALDAVLEAAYDDMDMDGPFARLVDAYGGQGGDETLQQLMLSLHDYARSLPDPYGWLREGVGAYAALDEATFDETPWASELRLEANVTIARALRLLRRALQVAHGPGGARAHAETIEQDIERLQQLRDAAEHSWSALAAIGERARFPALKRASKDDGDPDAKDMTKQLRDKARKLIHDMYDRLLARPLAEHLAALRELAPMLEALVHQVIRLDQEYAAAKAAQGLIDFADIEHLCLVLLRDSDVAGQIQARFDEVLVDECQDLNGVQDEILKRVTRPPEARGELFLVGDVKQSIYRFRQADPRLFLQRYQRASPDTNASEQRIDLRKNFRSRRSIVDAVNFVFRQIMTPTVGEMAYGTEAELVFGASFGPVQNNTGRGHDPPVELHLLERELEEDDEGSTGANASVSGTGAGSGHAAPRRMSALEREATLVAKRIQQLVREEEAVVWDGRAGRYRPARYGDIVILMRATKHRANELVNVLADAGVPAYAELGTGYFAATEIETMMALLSILDNPRQDIELAAVLRSPMIGCTPDDLARIRLCLAHGDFYDAVTAAASDDELGELRQTMETFLAFLDRARTMARRVPLSQLVWHLLKETGYYDYAGAMPGGRQRQANLRALHERARQFDAFARHGLARFLRFIQRLREADSDLGVAPAVGENDDVVRIMSVHTSKGLQFPIVFVVDCGRQFHRQPVHADLAFQRHLGLGARLVDGARRLSEPSLLHAAVTARRRREEMAEEMRLLYVAMTRAQERLIMVGSAKLASRAENWAAGDAGDGWPLADEHLLSAGGWLDWLCSALIRHPAAKSLWSVAQLDAPPGLLFEDTSRWIIRIWTDDDVLDLAEDAKAASAAMSWPAVAAGKLLERQPGSEDKFTGNRHRLASNASGDITPVRAELERRLSWRYPWTDMVGRPAKQGVSELKRRWDMGDEHEKAPVLRPTLRLDERPAFLQAAGGPLTATERGAAIHLVMQHLDLTAPLDEDDIARQIAYMVEKQMLTPEQGEAVDVQSVARFFDSPLGCRLRSSTHEVRREVPFTMALPATEAYPDLPGSVAHLAKHEIVVVQGIIDCLVYEDAGLLIVDYKTDQVSAAGARRRAARYQGQVELYRRAVREMYGTAEVDAYLVFLTPGVAVAVD